MKSALRPFLIVAAILCLAAPAGLAQAVLRPGDSFELRVSGPPPEYTQEFSLSYTIGDDGSVNVPLVGAVKAGGTNPQQLSRAIERKLIENKIFTNPVVTINLQAQSRFVTVGGAVRSSQAVAWSSDLTLSAAINRAGGYGDFATDKIRILRDGKTYNCSRKKMATDPAHNPKLLPGDEVIVME